MQNTHREAAQPASRNRPGARIATAPQRQAGRKRGDRIADEVKLGGRAAIDAAAESLKRLRDRIDPDVTGPPRRLVVITSGGYAYERTDGVCVAPITTLGP